MTCGKIGKDSNMATLETFKKTANSEYVGDIVTLSVQAKRVRIVPDENRRARSSQYLMQG